MPKRTITHEEFKRIARGLGAIAISDSAWDPLINRWFKVSKAVFQGPFNFQIAVRYGREGAIAAQCEGVSDKHLMDSQELAELGRAVDLGIALMRRVQQKNKVAPGI